MSNKKQKSENMIQGLEERFSPRHSDIALASKLMPSVMLKNPEALSSDQLRMIANAFQTCHRHMAYNQSMNDGG